jgi:hypothetical protein
VKARQGAQPTIQAPTFIIVEQVFQEETSKRLPLVDLSEKKVVEKSGKSSSANRNPTLQVNMA